MTSVAVKSGRIPSTAPPAPVYPLARRGGDGAPPRFQPIRQHRTFEEICQRIRSHLADGGLRPGDKLPPERELAAQLGVARNALREALRSLEAAGLVERRRGVNGGAFISEGNPGRMDQVVRDLLSQGSISVAHLTEARLHVLELVVLLACERATDADFAAIEANIERTRLETAAGRYLERVECSREFYRLLGAATANPVVGMMMHALSEILMQFVYARVEAGGPPQPRLVQARRALLKALRERDSARAVRLMRKHLEGVHRMLETSLGAARLDEARLSRTAR